MIPRRFMLDREEREGGRERERESLSTKRTNLYACTICSDIISRWLDVHLECWTCRSSVTSHSHFDPPQQEMDDEAMHNWGIKRSCTFVYTSQTPGRHEIEHSPITILCFRCRINEQRPVGHRYSLWNELTEHKHVHRISNEPKRMAWPLLRVIWLNRVLNR
jgi:hypothetical protein